MEILLSNRCMVLPAVVKQQQEEISCNHNPSLFAISGQEHLTLCKGLSIWIVYDGKLNSFLNLRGSLVPTWANITFAGYGAKHV